MRKASILMLGVVLAALAVAASPKSSSAKEKKMGGELRWHGVVVRTSEDGSVLTVRKGNIDKAVHVTADTKYTKQEDKKVADIEKGDIKEGDDVICLGKADEKGDFVATRVDKRLPK